MRIKVYLDEDVPFSFSQALLLRSVDVVTTQQVENNGLSDKDQLVYAIKTGRCVFTHNKRDFVLLIPVRNQDDTMLCSCNAGRILKV